MSTHLQDFFIALAIFVKIKTYFTAIFYFLETLINNDLNQTFLNSALILSRVQSHPINRILICF